jgi:molybdopterin-guanine dinucleotide biosynthesis protein A
MSSKWPRIEIAILTGGLSRRMGKDKSRLRLDRRTMLGQIRAEAKRTGLPVRVIRRDLVPRCGPLGGVYTALKTARAQTIMFLACDMPFIEAALLKTAIRRVSARNQALFLQSKGKAGFPFVLPQFALSVVHAQIENRQFSLQNLAKILHAKVLNPPSRWRSQLRNVNTPEDWKRALTAWKEAKSAQSQRA